MHRPASPARPSSHPPRRPAGRWPGATRHRAAARLAAAACPVVEPLEGRALFSVTPDPGATFATAFNVGDLNGARTLDDAVGPADPTDVYKFTLPRAGQFFGRIRALAAKAEVALVSEQVDPDGTIHEVFVDAVTANQDGPDAGFASGDLPARFLAAGDYFLIVTARGGDTPYLIRTTADYAGSSISAARDVGGASDATFQDFVGDFPSPSLNDPFDFYKVRMDAAGDLAATLSLDSTQADLFQAHVQLIRDFNGNGALDPGDVLQSAAPGTVTSVGLRVDAGTYFVRVVNDLNFSNYHLHVNADYAGQTPGTQRVAGPLDAGKSFSDFISAAADPLDQYTFSVGSGRPLNLVFREDGGTANLTLFRDRNNDGVAQPSEAVLSTDDRSFLNVLTTVQSGNYIVQVRAAGGAGAYQLFAEARPDRAGNALGTARDLGTVNGLTHQDDFVSGGDPVDFYKFTIAAAGRVSAQLDPQLGDDADLALIRDANHNGVVDAGEVLAASALPDNKLDELSKSVAAGTYFLRVSLKPSDGIGKYFLTFHTDLAGGTPAAARNVGTLAGTKAFDDWASGPFGGVISDQVDLYKLTLASAKTLTARMTGTLAGEDLDLELYRDKNHDGVLTADERVAVSRHADSPDEQIVKSLAAGTYFVRVLGVNGETNYHLSLKA